MNITVIGTGYVGLVVGTCLSDFGMQVVCIDNDADKINLLNQGTVPIYETGLTELVKRNVKLGRLSFTTDLNTELKKSDIIFIGVGTPETADGSPDLKAVYQVADAIANSVTGYKVIVNKSTVPVGTAKILKKYITDKLTHTAEIDIVSNPEFLREGSAVDDFLHPDRVILGSDSEKALTIVKELYQPVYLNDTPIIATTNETAEMIKYASNSMLALRISFINEMANICDRVGADITQVANAIGLDNRIGSKFLHPGPGYGGSCFPKDVAAIVKIARENNYQFKLAEAMMEVNAAQRELVVTKTKKQLGSLKNKTICLLGLSFKPNTDDVRESPSLYVAKRLLEEGSIVKAYDPIAMDETKKYVDGIKYCSDAYEASENADMVIIMTEWNEFRDLDIQKIKSLVRTPNLYDTRNIYNPARINNYGFTYLCTGRPVK